MTKRLFFLGLLGVTMGCLHAQTEFREDFSNREQVVERWQGTWANWCITPDHQLQLQAVKADTSFLACESNTSGKTQWEVQCHTMGALSAANQLRCYVVADEANPIKANGYYIQIGGANRNIRLTRSKNGTDKAVIENPLRKNILSSDSHSILVRLSRDCEGLFRLESRIMDVDTAWVEEGTYVDKDVESEFVILYARNSKGRGMDFGWDYVEWESDICEEPQPPIEQPSDGNQVWLIRDSFSPNGDGYEDDCGVGYSLDEVGCLATMTIYSPSGITIRHACTAEELGTEGVLTWDGKNDSGRVAEMGVYVMVLEITHRSGTTIRRKWTVALVRG